MNAQNESVGENFATGLLQKARDKSLQVILETAKLVTLGMRESEARKALTEIQADLGAPKTWHGPQIRFGENTLLAFGEKGLKDPALNDNDIYFFDIGPVFDGHEGDVGRTFSVGNDTEMIRCCKDVEAIWHSVFQYWKKESVSGAALYAYAAEQARERDWILSLKGASGHRVADFPHTARRRGAVARLNQALAPDRWILEIQIRHPDRPFGAFYEDLLS